MGGHRRTVSCEKCDGGTLCASTTSTTNTMDIILRVVRIVIVEHMGNVADIFDGWVSKNSKSGIATSPGRG